MEKNRLERTAECKMEMSNEEEEQIHLHCVSLERRKKWGEKENETDGEDNYRGREINELNVRFKKKGTEIGDDNENKGVER